MYVIQNGPSWWIDSTARFPTGEVQQRGRIGAMSDTLARNPLDIDETDHSVDSLNSVVSDYEEEGEAGGGYVQIYPSNWGMDNITDEVESNKTIGASEEIVAAVAKHIEVIEQAMRLHQSSGVFKFVGEDQENPADESFNQSVKDAMFDNSDAAFAATQPSQDRQGLFALLNA